MWQIKLRLLAKSLIVIVLYIGILGAIFYASVQYYTQANIQKCFDEQGINGYKYFLHADRVYFSLETGFDKMLESGIIIQALITNSDFYDAESNYDGLLEYCRQHPELIDKAECTKIEIDGEPYYFVVRSSDSDEKDEIMILIANPKIFLKFVKMIDWIFMIIMTISGMFVFVFSYKKGMSVQKEHITLTKYFQNASHELKTPIMSIQGYAEGICENVIRDHKRAAEIIMAESEKMSELVEEILYLSKLDSGDENQARTKIDLVNLLNDCMEQVKMETAKDVTFSLDQAFGQFITFGSERQLERAFVNILTNGVRYAKSYITLTIEEEGKWLKIHIMDDGPGISQQDLPHIFERFYKGEGGGHGIGLAIASDIIAYHRGKIRAVNNGGADFEVDLRKA